MFTKIKDKINEKDVGLAKDYFTMLINSCGYENHCHDDYVNTLDEKYLKEWRKARIIRSDLMDLCFKLFNVEPKDESWCFHPNTKIVTSEGMKDIAEVKIGDTVLTHKNRFKEVIQISQRKINDKLKLISTTYTNIPIKVTENHLFYVAENVRTRQEEAWKKNFVLPKLVWKRADELTDKDFLYLPRYNLTNDIEKVKTIYKNNHGFEDSLNLKLNNDVMRLIGLYLAEGHHTMGRLKKITNGIYFYNNIGLTFGSHENYLSEFVIKTFREEFNYTTKPAYRKSTIEFSIGKRVIGKFFNQFGSCASNKHIPKWILDLPKEKLIELVRGMFEGDGSQSKYYFSYVTVSRELAYGLRLILSKIGVLSSIKNNGKCKDSVINGRIIKSRYDSYSVLISGDSAREFSKLLKLDYDGGKKTSGCFGYVGDDYFLIPINKINSEKYFGNVYNLEVEEDESYCTFQGIAHNCKMKHISIVAMGCQENAVRLIEDGLIDEIQKLAKEERECYIIFLNLLEINENNAKVISSA